MGRDAGTEQLWLTLPMILELVGWALAFVALLLLMGCGAGHHEPPPEPDAGAAELDAAADAAADLDAGTCCPEGASWCCPPADVCGDISACCCFGAELDAGADAAPDASVSCWPSLPADCACRNWSDGVCCCGDAG